jgi:hypothetical protein
VQSWHATPPMPQLALLPPERHMPPRQHPPQLAEHDWPPPLPLPLLLLPLALLPPPLHEPALHVWELDVQSWHAAPRLPQRVSVVAMMHDSPSQQPRQVVAQLPPPSWGPCPDDALVARAAPPAPPSPSAGGKSLPDAQAGGRGARPSRRTARKSSDLRMAPHRPTPSNACFARRDSRDADLRRDFIRI